MKICMRRTVGFVVGGLLLGVLITGCTLTGASPAALTPVGDTGVQPTTEDLVQTEEVLPPAPTRMASLDVFGTQTAQALLPTTAGPSEATPGTPAGTQEPGGGIIVPTTSGPIEVTPLATVAGPTTAPTQGGAASCPATHTVAAGENLFRIALRYGLTTAELAAANGITNTAVIQVGQVLQIPHCGDEAGTGTPGTGTSGERTHTVAAGENLFRIALQYGLTWQELAEYNNITNPAALQVGQVLRIPPED